jgi:hypothetical protein
MKKIKLIPILAILFMLNVASMCSNDDQPSTSQSIDPTPVINTVKSGTWRVTFYEESGLNHTSYFTNYNFTFAALNVLTANNGTNNYVGTWSVTSDDSGDDSPTNDLDFNIGFATPTNFEELTEDWNILERTDTKVRLVHISGGNGGTDYITFEKN